MGGNAGAQRGPAGQSRSPFATPTMRPIGTGGWPYSFGNNRAQCKITTNFRVGLIQVKSSRVKTSLVCGIIILVGFGLR